MATIKLVKVFATMAHVRIPFELFATFRRTGNAPRRAPVPMPRLTLLLENSPLAHCLLLFYDILFLRFRVLRISINIKYGT